MHSVKKRLFHIMSCSILLEKLQQQILHMMCSPVTVLQKKISNGSPRTQAGGGGGDITNLDSNEPQLKGGESQSRVSEEHVRSRICLNRSDRFKRGYFLKCAGMNTLFTLKAKLRFSK